MWSSRLCGMFLKQLVVCAFVFCVTSVFCQTQQPIVYLDNGLDGTGVDHRMTIQEKMMLETEILYLLGLPKRPRRARSSIKMSASRYLMDVYKKIMQEENEENDRVKREDIETDITNEEFRKIEESDTIMAFESLDNRQSTFRHKLGSTLWFNISQTPSVDAVLGGELRIFKNTTTLNNKEYSVKLWQVIKDEGSEHLKFITAVNITSDYVGWVTFNVTSCLRSWMTSNNWTQGIYLIATPLVEPGKNLKIEDIGLTISKGHEETKPFMVAFMKGSIKVKLRKRREAEKKSPSGDFMDLVKGTYGDTKPAENSRTCRRFHLFISFKDLMWQDWIIAPDGYSSYYCAGECSFPLHGTLNATNHAIVQTLVHLIHPRRYPKPCCSPFTVKPVSILFSLDDVNVVLKKYKKMMVKSCGCH